MSRWTDKHIHGLIAAGKIKGARFGERHRKDPGSVKGLSKKTSKALAWLELNLAFWSNEHALTMEREHRFCPDRGWRFDFCWPSIMAALEFEGGIFMAKSGHNTARHYTKDSEKYNQAAVLGWRVIRVTALNYQTALRTLDEIIS